ncbi:LacI family DNA-binding transcriptional regulator, partial [Aeromicrobium sp. CnD17-E]|uniref:LacI family DNA-binding transcriptional regulator n=1 Tax=Aeromicrobium sp. CnD17-E TaxID=2954487 RepID=UPI00209836E6
MARTTLADVAREAGVSVALVSIVMRDAPGASDATRARVRDVADRLGYVPDQRARLLRSTDTRLLGVTFDLHQPFHGDLVEHLYAAAADHGYDVAISAVAPSRDERSAVQALRRERCDALVLLGPDLSPDELAALGADLPTLVVARR